MRAHAERGVLQEFQEGSGARGRFEARFKWLLPKPLRFVVDVARRRLSCPEMLDDIGAKSVIRRELTAFVAGRHGEELPEHRRVDPARCAIHCSVRASRMTMALDVRDDDWEYATVKLMSLVHETYIYIHRYWPEYAYETLGSSSE